MEVPLAPPFPGKDDDSRDVADDADDADDDEQNAFDVERPPHREVLGKNGKSEKNHQVKFLHFQGPSRTGCASKSGKNLTIN